MEQNSTTESVDAIAQSGAAAPVERRGWLRAWTTLAIIMSSATLLVQFTPSLQRQIMEITGSGPSTTVLVGNASDPVSSSTARLESDVAGLEQSIASLEAAALAGEETSKTVRMIQERINVVEGEVKALRVEMEASAEQIRKAVDSVARPGELPLIAARIALRHAAGALDKNDAAVLAELAAEEQSLIEPVARLRVLADQDIPTLGALRDSYHDRRHSAAATAGRARLDWWQFPVSYARSGLSDWGVSQPAAEEKDQDVIRTVSDELDAGRLEQALFELQAGSLELRTELSSWESAARLRLALDQTVIEIVDGVLNRLSSLAGMPASR
jgi:exonuclease VII small subunit